MPNSKYLILGFVFITGITIGLFLWSFIILPFNNPWGIVSTLADIEYNPFNNVVRFVVLILMPSILLILMYFFLFKTKVFSKRDEDYMCIKAIDTRNTVFLKLIFLLSLSIIFALKVPTHHATSEWFDSFHEGESLGTAISYIDGGIPYKDFIFCHGVYQDPLRSVIAFNLFGKSIGAARTLESLIKVISFVLMAFFIFRIFKNRLIPSLALLILIILLHFSSYTQFFFPDFIKKDFILIIPREIVVFLFLILVSYVNDFINNRLITKTKINLLFFFFSFLPFVSIALYIDRGIYLFATYLLVYTSIYICFVHRNELRKNILTASFFGFFIAILMLSYMLKGHYYDFMKYSFYIMPKYHELLDGYVYPIFEPRFLIICIFIAVNTFWVVFKFLQEKRKSIKMFLTARFFLQKYLIELCLLILSVFLFKNALGRADLEHVLYSSCLTYLLFFYILIKYYLWCFFRNNYIALITKAIAILLLLLFTIKIISNNTIQENFPYKVHDTIFIPENYKATIAFLKNNLNEDEYFYTMTSEASWYYFLNKPCPNRFPVVWFAAPYFYQQEVVNEFSKKNVKYILYKNSHWANSIDGYDNEIRLPIIINYLNQNYMFYKRIDDNEIWINKKSVH